VTRTLPKGVWFQRKVLSSGEVVRYGYLGRGDGAVPLGREGSADFHFRLAEAIRRAPDERRFEHLIWRYRSSKEFAALAPRTQADYRKHLDRIQNKFGKLRTPIMEMREMSDRIFKWRDQLAEASPRQADYTISVLGAMLAWCIKRGLMNNNRAKGVGDVYHGDRRDKVWTPEAEAKLLKEASPAVARAFILATETGLAQKDVLTLPWSAVQGNIIVTIRSKTGQPVAAPISPMLKAMLDAAPKTADTIITQENGKPYDKKGNGFRSSFLKARADAEITGLTFHDARGTFVTRRIEAGWTSEEVALCAGHKIAGDRSGQAAYRDPKRTAIANAERLWERNYLQTPVQTSPPEGDMQPT
jgi:integrase